MGNILGIKQDKRKVKRNERELTELILETVNGHLIYADDLNMWIVDDDFMLALSEQEYTLLQDSLTASRLSYSGDLLHYSN